ncbi:MAG: TonB-dependent receptor [Acidobacteria bacterium]|nr:TonB-dependent receptor [Acidobacteriota bacterium]
MHPPSPLRFVLFVVMSVASAAAVPPALGQDVRGAVEGRVIDPDGLGVPGIVLQLAGPGLPSPRTSVSEGAQGAFRFDGLTEPGIFTLTADGIGLYQPALLRVEVAKGRTARVELRLALGFSEEVTVTEAREGRLKKETPVTIDTVGGEVLEELKPTHPSQVMSQVPGVWVNVTSGEGHQTAIRQPLTTSPVYLYLEDGVPTRSTGFFNHNALYEVNVSAAEGVEVTKGPGSALYGSDAIGGVVNVVTRSALGPSAGTVEGEAGGYGWRRLIAGGNLSSGTSGLRADINLTHSGGWRDATGYDRQTGTLRWDRVAGSGSAWKTLLAFSNIDQQTAGSSALQEDDYFAVPTRNLTPISFRKVKAFRLSTDYQRAVGPTSFNVVPYFRYDTMGLLANWTLTYDPTVSDTSNASYGLLAKVRHSFPRWRADAVAGVDFDVSPGGRTERQIAPKTVATANGKRIFASYTAGASIYDYDVTYTGVAPYVQVDFSPANRLRVQAGVRLDRASYAYDDTLTATASPRYLRPADTSRRYTHLSPKLGATYQITGAINAFGSYRHAFRAPSEGQLFRQGSTRNTVDLRPVKAHNYELGVRARISNALSVEASAYRLAKKDDILSYRDPFDGLTHVLNAGETLHRGVELGTTLTPAAWLRASANFTRARHTYEHWVVDPLARIDYGGREMETAPSNMGNLGVSVRPGARASVSAEMNYLGGYWMDAANTQRYGGHTLFNLRTQVRIAPRLSLFARLLNLADRRYAESASYTVQRGRELAPGAPRTGFVGVTVDWRP